MSDIGTYNAIEAEIVAALSTPPIDDVKDVLASHSLEDLYFHDSKRRPAMGIIERDAIEDPKADQQVGLKPVRAQTTWDISFVVDHKRGRTEARTLLRKFMETVHDRLHNLRSAVDPKARYRWRADKMNEKFLGESNSVATAVSTFTLGVNFGK